MSNHGCAGDARLPIVTKRAVISTIGFVCAAIVSVGLALGYAGYWGPNRHRPTPRMPTITALPPFPRIPTSGVGLSRQQRDAAIQTLVNHKVSTYPLTSSRGCRVSKFTSTGIFGGFPPTEDQIARIAPHYDDILLGAARHEFIPRFRGDLF